MMRNWFASIQKEWNFIAQKYASQDPVILIELPHQDGCLSKSSSLSHEPQDFAPRKYGFRLRVGALHQADGRQNGTPLRIRFRFCPGPLQMLQLGRFRKPRVD